MAADRGMREEENNAAELGPHNCTDGSHSAAKGLCKKNGMTHGCHCTEKAAQCRTGETRRGKVGGAGARVNGMTTTPTLRSSASRASSNTNNNGSPPHYKPPSSIHESPGKRRRSLRASKQDCDDRNSAMGPVVNEAASTFNTHHPHHHHNGVTVTDIATDHTNSALVCSQPTTDICTNVQSTLLGPISPDTSRSCTPPLSVSSSQSLASCTSSSSGSILNYSAGANLTSLHQSDSSTDVQHQSMDVGDVVDVKPNCVSIDNSRSISSSGTGNCSSSTSTSGQQGLILGKCNGALINDRNSLCSLFPCNGNRGSHCSSNNSGGCLRFGTSSLSSSSMPSSAGSSSSSLSGINFPLVNRSVSSSSNLSCSSNSSSINGTNHHTAQASSSNNGRSNNGKPGCNTPVEVTCQWTDCTAVLLDHDLMDHIKKAHVEPQFNRPAKTDPDATDDDNLNSSEGSTKFVCLWTGCKVYNKPSSSQTWIQRHIIAHSGDKPFQCIVDGCGQRFTSQSGLERHVNSHFNMCPPVKSCSSKGGGDTPSKLLKRKKLRRKKSWLMKTEDFFDSRAMESIRHQLVMLSEFSNVSTDTSAPTQPTVTFHSSVIARRKESSGKVKVLLRWTPKDILPDSWVLESQMEEMQQKTVPITSLPRDTIDSLHPSIYARHRYRKHRRK